jgi:nucleoside-diphosphate-sugar epimerase
MSRSAPSKVKVGSSRKLLVTGASGFLGSEILRLVPADAWQIRGLVRNPHNRVPGVETVVGDIGDRKALEKACEGVAAVIHAAGLAHVFGRAARDQHRFTAVNEAGTANVVDAALDAGVSNFVLISSVSVYGSYPGAQCDETVPCNPRGPYAISKRQAELRAIERTASRHCSLTILRFATLYGEGDRGNVAKLISALDRGRFIWPGNGENRKSLIYKEDAARACLCALNRAEHGTRIFNVSARPATMKEIVTAACEALARPIPNLRVPLAAFKLAGAASRAVGDPGNLGGRLQKFIHDDVYSGAKFEAAFDFCPAVTLSNGIRREVEFLRTAR